MESVQMEILSFKWNKSEWKCDVSNGIGSNENLTLHMNNRKWNCEAPNGTLKKKFL